MQHSIHSWLTHWREKRRNDLLLLYYWRFNCVHNKIIEREIKLIYSFSIHSLLIDQYQMQWERKSILNFSFQKNICVFSYVASLLGHPVRMAVCFSLLLLFRFQKKKNNHHFFFRANEQLHQVFVVLISQFVFISFHISLSFVLVSIKPVKLSSSLSQQSTIGDNSPSNSSTASSSVKPKSGLSRNSRYT